MYLTDKHAFIHCNKCAGVFIKDFMTKHMDTTIHKYKHAPIRMLSEKYRKLKKIGAVRNPFAWYLSYYNYHKDNGYYQNLSFEEYIKRNTSNSRNLLSLMPKKLRKKFSKLYPPNTKMPIGAYTFHYINYFCYDAINVLKEWDYDYFRLNINKISNLDVTFRVERLKVDMLQEFGPQYAGELTKFPKKNVSKSKKHYRDIFTPYLRNKVLRCDGALMEYLGYSY